MEEIAEAWQVDFDVHVIRKDVYKGKLATGSKRKLRFDAVTCPGFFLMVSRPRITCNSQQRVFVAHCTYNRAATR